MPLKRYEIRNEYSLADPELYKIADKDDPEALLEGVAMAGLVGVLRQLGDLAEYAAEIFHDLHEEVMSTAARGHGLIVRVQQLEADFPMIERKLLSQTSHTSFLYNSSIDWKPNLRIDQNTVTQGDMPRFIMDSYEECRGPPRLFLLDKFDVAGAGACLKRFTDPSFFKVEYASSTGRKLENQREKKARRIKKRGPRWRNGDTPESHASSHAKLHQLFLEESIESGVNDPDRRVKLKKRQFTGSLFNQESAKSYMENFLDTCPPEQRTVHEVIEPLHLTWTSNNASDSGLEIVEIGTVSPLKESIEYEKNIYSSPDSRDILVKPSMDEIDDGKPDGETVEVLGLPWKSHNDIISPITKAGSREDIADKESISEVSMHADACSSDDVASEMDNYMDALATIESEIDTDSECKKYPRYSNLKPVAVDSDGSLGQHEHYGGFLDSQSIGTSSISEDYNNYDKKGLSSCSDSGNASSETTRDSDAVVTSSNADHEKFSEYHFESMENVGREIVWAGTSTGKDKAKQELPEESGVSCLTKELSKDSPLMENSLLSPEMTETSSNSADGLVVPGTAAQSSSSTDRDVPDKIYNGHWSDEPSIYNKAVFLSAVDTGTSSHPPKTSDGLTNPLHSVSLNVHSSSEEQAKDAGTADEGAICSGISLCLEQPSISGSEFPDIVNYVNDFASVPCLQHPRDQVPSGSTEHRRRVSSNSTVGEAELTPLVVNELQALSPETPSVSISEAVDVAECSSFEADGCSGDLPNCEMSFRIADGSTADDSTMIHTIPSPIDQLKIEGEFWRLPSEIIDDTPSLHQQIDSGKQHPGYDTFIEGEGDSVSRCKGNKCDLESEAVDGVPSSEISPNDRLGEDKDVFSTETLLSGSPCNEAYDPNSVRGADGTVVDCPGITAITDQNVVCSSASPEMLSILPLSSTEESHQNEDELMKRLGRGSRENKHIDTVEHATVNSNSNLCSVSSDVSVSASPHNTLPEESKTSFQQIHLFGRNENNMVSKSEDVLKPELPAEAEGKARDIASDGVRPEYNNHDKHVQTPECVVNEGWIDAAASYDQSQPSASNTPPQSAHQILESGSQAMMDSNLGNSDGSRTNDAIYVAQLEDSRNLVSSPDVLLNEAPPLPPLPPMQWRLGRFQNSSASPERQMVPQRVGYVQTQSGLLPAKQHAPGLAQTMNIATVHNTFAPAQSIAVPAGQYTLAPVQQMTPPAPHHTHSPVPPITLPLMNEAVSVAETYRTEGYPGSSDWHVTQGGSTLPTVTAAPESFYQNGMSAMGRSDNLLLSVPSSSEYMSVQGGSTLPMLATASKGSSQDNQLIHDHLISTGRQTGTESSETHHQLNGAPDDLESFNESHISEEFAAVVEAADNVNVCPRNELLDSQATEQGLAHSHVQFLSPSPVHQSSAGFVASETDRSWLSLCTYDGVPSHAGDNTNGVLQKKLPRPRNPLIDEVVAIDKSKLRKVERVKPSLEPKAQEGDSLREQMQLRKVEKVKPLLDRKASDGESILEQLQLRKVGERVKPSVEQKSEEREFLPEQLQLRKVTERVIPDIEQRVEETESPRVQLRKVSQRVKQEVDSKSEETESPRIQLRKVGEKTPPVVGPPEATGSLFEQIRNKSFNLKPAVAARPNIQGPRTNLKVAAILEKASNIRQAMAGSDEDDDADTWSDC